MWDRLDRRAHLVLLLIAAAVLFGAGAQFGRWSENRSQAALVLQPGGGAPLAGQAPGGVASPGSNPDSGEPKLAVAVHVVGAVSRPGVYQLGPGARVEEAVKMAGPLPEADINLLNLAAPLVDGQQVVVPKAGESQPGVTTPGAPGSAGSASGPALPSAGSSTVSGKVNINSAGVPELDKLPGIGPTLAQRIVDYRSQHGPFRSPEDIKNVSGIGDSRYDQIKDLISVY